MTDPPLICDRHLVPVVGLTWHLRGKYLETLWGCYECEENRRALIYGWINEAQRHLFKRIRKLENRRKRSGINLNQRRDIMSFFRKKTVIIEAHQWQENGDHPADNTKVIPPTKEGEKGFLSEGEVVRRFRHPEVDGKKQCEKCYRNMHFHGWIENEGDGHTVCPGDWIVKETGENEKGYHPCKPATFREIYEKLSDHAEIAA